MFLSWLDGYVEKQFDKVNFKIYDVTDRITKTYRQLDIKIWSVNKI